METGNVTSRIGVVSLALLIGVVVAIAAASGAGVRSSINARVTGDEPEYLLTALSLAEDRSLDVADEIGQERYRSFHEVKLRPQARLQPDGRMVSPHDPLLPFLLAPAMGIAGVLGAKLLLAVVAGALAALLVWLAVRRMSTTPATAALVVGVLGVSAPLAVYGSQVYPELPAALAVAVAVAGLTGSGRIRDLVALTAAVVALCWLSVKYVPVAAVLAGIGLWQLWVRGRLRRALGVLGVWAAAALLYVWGHLDWYGALTVYAAGQHFSETGQFSVVGVTPNYYSRSTRLIGLIVDGRFGLAAWQPAWLVMPLAVAGLAAVRSRHWQVLLLPLGAGWLIATFVALTMHGFWFPGRQVVVVLPLAVLAIAGWLDERPAARWAFAVLGLLGVVNLAWLLWEGYTSGMTLAVHFQDTTSTVYRAISVVLPHYMQGSARSWALHGMWVALGLAGVALAVWDGRRRSAS